MMRRLFLITLLAIPCLAMAQKHEASVNIKTNLLYDATTTLNVGAEIRTGDNSSLDIPLSWNPWGFSRNRKWKHILVQPEFRYWLREAFDGHFFGIHAHYAYYNVGRLPHGPFSKFMAKHRFQGQAVGAGISYGYRWNFRNPRWAMEATVGVGYAYLDYDKYACRECAEKLGHDTKNYFGPTKVGLSLIYNIGRKKPARTVEPVYIPVEMPVELQPEVIIEPEPVEAKKEYRMSGSAYLDFAVGRSEIVAGFEDNAAELKMLDELVASVKGNPDATITGIIITGYASPEGTWQLNKTLSEERAAALTDYIETQYGFPASIFTTTGEGEDWATLEKLVADSDITQRDEILNIIRSEGIFDGREADLMRLAGGGPYRQMKAEMFPKLRRVEYELLYIIEE